ncbi:MAG TPA: hypothetical protein VGR66_13605, partial [Candidatus Eisenbacteria bacterium]|nr:hypothetical protein [Candidatus Eisenbacteria bacterium]
GRSIAWIALPSGTLPQLCTIDTSGVSRKVLTPALGGLDWSPTDDRIVFVGDTDAGPRLFMIRRDGSHREQLTFQ